MVRSRGLAAFVLLLSVLTVAFAVSDRGGSPQHVVTASEPAAQPRAEHALVLPPYIEREPPVPAPKAAGRSGMTSDLDELYRVDAVARALGGRIRASNAATLPANLSAEVAANRLALDNGGRVQVFVDTGDDPHAVAASLVALGMEVQRVSDEYRIVQGMLPVSALEQAAGVEGALLIRPPDRALRSAGSLTTQGDAILDANDLRANFGVTGAGVKVGVIANGLEGLAQAQASGDLPGSVNFTTCDVIASAPAGQPADPTSTGAGSEGTAVMEIVHDIAPGAELWFGYFGYNTTTATLLDFMAAQDCLAQRVDVIVDDIVFVSTGPYDGTSPVSQNASTELNSAIRPLRGYYNAAGNFALQHYQELYVDDLPGLNNFSDFHRFQATATTTNQGVTATSSGVLNPIWLQAGGIAVVHLQWNDTWGAAAQDYDLYALRNDTGETVAESFDEQDGTAGDLPVEIIVIENTGAAGYFDIAIDRYEAAIDVTLDMFVTICQCVPLPLTQSGPGLPFLNYNTVSSSIPNNSDAGGGVMAIGAITASQPGNNTIAPYSGRGPTNATASQPTPRTKPDVTAIDGVVVSGAGGFLSPFFGTSAAAPHAAGIAALILSCRPQLKHGEAFDNPALDRTILRDALINNAVDLGAGGIDNVYGGGRVDADAAAAAAGCTPPPDSDADGCTDQQELGTNEVKGGDRDPLYAGDFFDVTGDRSIDVADTIAVLGRFGFGPAAPGYSLMYDRYIPDQAKPWRTAFATGPHVGIDVADAVTNLRSFGHSCVS